MMTDSHAEVFAHAYLLPGWSRFESAADFGSRVSPSDWIRCMTTIKGVSHTISGVAHLPNAEGVWVTAEGGTFFSPAGGMPFNEPTLTTWMHKPATEPHEPYLGFSSFESDDAVAHFVDILANQKGYMFIDDADVEPGMEMYTATIRNGILYESKAVVEHAQAHGWMTKDGGKFSALAMPFKLSARSRLYRSLR